MTRLPFVFGKYEGTGTNDFRYLFLSGRRCDPRRHHEWAAQARESLEHEPEALAKLEVERPAVYRRKLLRVSHQKLAKAIPL